MNLEKIKVVVLDNLDESIDEVISSILGEDIESNKDIIDFVHDLSQLQKTNITLINDIIDLVITNLADALTLLTEKQKIIFYKLIFKSETISSISKELMLDRKTVRDHYNASIRKIKKYYLNDNQLLSLLQNLK